MSVSEANESEGRGGNVPAVKSCMARKMLSTWILSFLTAGADFGAEAYSLEANMPVV